MVTRVTKKKAQPVGHQLGPRFTDPDIVDRMFEFIVEQFPEMSSDRINAMRTATRAEFRGAECYVPVRSPTDRQQLVSEALRLFNGRNATEIARRLHLVALVCGHLDPVGQANVIKSRLRRHGFKIGIVGLLELTDGRRSPALDL